MRKRAGERHAVNGPASRESNWGPAARSTNAHMLCALPTRLSGHQRSYFLSSNGFTADTAKTRTISKEKLESFCLYLDNDVTVLGLTVAYLSQWELWIWRNVTFQLTLCVLSHRLADGLVS